MPVKDEGEQSHGCKKKIKLGMRPGSHALLPLTMLRAGWVSSMALMVRILVVSAQYLQECSPVIAIIVVADACLCIAGTLQDFKVL